MLCEILRFKVFGPMTSIGLRFYSTVLVLRQTIYGGRLLLVIALVIARHVHGSEMTQIWDPYSGNGSGDTALINAAMYGA